MPWSDTCAVTLEKASPLEQLQRRLAEFRDVRDWQQFHTLKNLSAAIAIEAAELQEVFLWADARHEGALMDKRRSEVEDEVADVFIQLLNFVAIANIDLIAVAEDK